MLAIILQILKILGIIVLILLGILLFVILTALFVPVRYQAKGYYAGTYEVQAKATWLMHMVSVRVVYSKGQALLIVVKLLGITVFHNLKNEQKKLKKEKRVQVAEQEVNTNLKERDEKNIILPVTQVQPHTRPRKIEQPISKEIDVEKEKIEEKSSFLEKIRAVIKKFITQIVNIKYTIQKSYATIKGIKENITYYMQILHEDSTKEAIRLCKKQLLRIGKNVKPKVFLVHVHLGMEDSPDKLGQILAIWGMAYPFHKGNIAIQAEFDKTVMEGDFLIKGHITLYVYLWTLYLFLFDKNIRRVKKRLLREEL